MAPLCAICCAAAAISACTSSPARRLRPTRSRERRFARPKSRAFDARPYVFALIAVAVATGISALLWPWIGLPNTDLVFLTAIVGVAVRFGLWPSLLASIASALCYNFFFTEPYYTFTIADPRNVIAVVFFTIVAIVVSNVAARARDARRYRHGTGAHHRVALCLQPQAVRRRNPRRCPLGDGLPDRRDAEGEGRPAAAREWHRSR